jgi:single-strand DNA-binding protein
VSVNRCTFVGRLTANPTTDILPAKGAKPAAKIARFSIAVNRYWRDAEGHKQRKTEFVDFVAWDNNASITEKYMRRGQRVYVEGQFQTLKWVNEQGHKQKKVQIYLERVLFLGDGKHDTERDDED